MLQADREQHTRRDEESGLEIKSQRAKEVGLSMKGYNLPLVDNGVSAMIKKLSNLKGAKN